MKGELEEAVKKLNFQKLLIFRPSILEGFRSEKRVGEKIGLVFMRFLTRFMFKKYKPTAGNVLASKMISLSIDRNEGFRMIEANELFLG